MKNTMKLIFVTLALMANPLSAATVTWGPTGVIVGVNDVFTIDVIGLGFTGNVDGGGVNFSYNASVLNVQSVSVDESVWDLGVGISTGVIDNVAGTVNGIMVNAWSPVTGDFTVASVTFQAVGAGTTSLFLSESLLNPWASGGSLINPGYLDAPVIVTASAVPVPAAVWLFGSGLVGLLGGGLGKRRAA